VSVFAGQLQRGAHHQPIPRLLTARDSKIKQTIQISRLEVEEALKRILWIPLQRLENPHQRVLSFAFRVQIDRLHGEALNEIFPMIYPPDWPYLLTCDRLPPVFHT